MGNQDPESGVVRSEVKHVWMGVATNTWSCFTKSRSIFKSQDSAHPAGDAESRARRRLQQNTREHRVVLFCAQSETFLATHQNAAQRVLDGMNAVIQTVSEYSAGPTKAVAAWLTDQVAPPYWRPNAEIAVSRETGADPRFRSREGSRPLLPGLSRRPAAAARRCLRTQRGSTTAGPAGRASATPVPLTGCRCQSEAGAAPPSGSAPPATSREPQLTPAARASLRSSAPASFSN